MSRHISSQVAVLGLVAAMAAGCSDGGSPSNQGQLNFNLATKAAAPAVASAASFGVTSVPETFTDGTNTLVLNQVQLVLREIELERAEATIDCAVSTSDDACEKLELGPILLDLPLGTPGAARTFSVEVTPGTFDEVEFEIHKPSSDEDAAFVQANPDFDGVSIRVTGTYNGESFVFTSDLNVEEEIDLNPPLVTSEMTATELTLFVNLDAWFRDLSGGLVDPRTANKGAANEGLVKDNIKNALEAFEDEDHDGSHD